MNDAYVNTSQLLMSRRQMLYGALGAGAAVGLGAAGLTLTGCSSDDDEEITVLEVPEDNVFSLDDCEELTAGDCMQCTGMVDLPYGTLVWANSDTVAACLLPTDTASPLTQVGILTLGAMNCTTVLQAAATTDASGFEIYDVRCSESGVVWTEANCLTGEWRIYQASLDSDLTLGTPVQADAGGTDYDIPHIAAAGDYAFWQVMPDADGAASSEPSLLKRARFGASGSETAWTSYGRMCSPIYSTGTEVVISPRVDTDGVYHQLTCLDATSLAVRDTLVLPTSMKPFEIAWGTSGFSFCFDVIYDYGDGIANLGTYTPAEDGTDPGRDWFRFSREPMACPAWCGDYFIVKSTTAIAGVHLASRGVFVTDTIDGCDSYGDYLASSGTRTRILSYSAVDSTANDEYTTRVRLWEAV